MKIHNVEQQSREWMQLHLGIPTASGLDNLLTPEFELRKGEMPRSYVFRKVAEAWRGKPLIDLGASSFAMEQGLILESEAIPFWELTTGRKITRVGFITTDDGRFGCSPDGLILKNLPAAPVLAEPLPVKPRNHRQVETGGEARESTNVKPAGRLTLESYMEQDSRGGRQSISDVGIEIKCPAPHTHVKYLCDGVIPKEYRAQVYGGMFATGFSKWVFLSYCRGFPPLILEVSRDEKAEAAIIEAIKLFHASFTTYEMRIERIQANPLNEFKSATICVHTCNGDDNTNGESA